MFSFVKGKMLLFVFKLKSNMFKQYVFDKFLKCTAQK